MRSVSRTGRARSRRIRRPAAVRRTRAVPECRALPRAMMRPRARTTIRTVHAAGQLTRTENRRCRSTVARERRSSRTRGEPAGGGDDGVAAGAAGAGAAAGAGGAPGAPGGPERKLSIVEWPEP